jgi:hypothetical protein
MIYPMAAGSRGFHRREQSHRDPLARAEQRKSSALALCLSARLSHIGPPPFRDPQTTGPTRPLARRYACQYI